ncbi:LysR family transcriptional regulator [Pigmentiphaga aceris]|uniref:LysR family transcriptional regulator n=1 Tax=Pigmentiphaga aceris TaxID=1940612 RepID=A0A5C0B4Q1_9BURK|nr:LysR substrate-binding domain-containing protein [Pigmentiphaga aceris]QEI08633.1 LysR family transcriptional regulator [Pigmentiphaga aceris]
MRKLPSFFALRAFEAAARLESFALAADELHLTPSAISHQIRGLEDYFGLPLFLRRNRGVALTADGMRLAGQLFDAFDAIESACADLRPVSSARTLAVHSSPSFATQWLGPRLPRFMASHPDIDLSMSSAAEPIDLLRHPEVDISIAYGNPLRSQGVTTEALGQEEIAPLCAPAWQNQVPDMAMLAQSVLIDSRLNPVRWRDWLALNGAERPSRRSRPSFDRASLAIAAAVDGLGVALESTRLAEQELQRGTLVIPCAGTYTPVLRETHFLSYRTVDRRLPNVMQFRAWLFAEAGITP